jgi:GT2 family glycosyltransferase
MNGALRASVIVPTHGGWPVLEKCLESLHDQRFESFEVIVVNDGSQDGTPERVRARFPAVRVFSLAINRGFCAAVNEGLRGARGEILALLNNDAVADPDWLSALVHALDEDPELGFCASRMVRADDPSRLDGAGDEYSRHGLSYRVGRGLLDCGQFGPREVLWASGGACAYRRSVLENIGLLDERLGSYYEDIDLGLRAWTAGWRGRYVPESVVRHVGHWTESTDRVVFLTTRNSLLLVIKHWPARLIARHLPFLVYGQFRGAAWAVRHHKASAWWAGVRAAVQLAPNFRQPSTRREAVWRGLLAPSYPFGRRVGLPAQQGAETTARRGWWRS